MSSLRFVLSSLPITYGNWILRNAEEMHIPNLWRVNDVRARLPRSSTLAYIELLKTVLPLIFFGLWINAFIRVPRMWRWVLAGTLVGACIYETNPIKDSVQLGTHLFLYAVIIGANFSTWNMDFKAFGPNGQMKSTSPTDAEKQTIKEYSEVEKRLCYNLRFFIPSPSITKQDVCDAAILSMSLVAVYVCTGIGDISAVFLSPPPDNMLSAWKLMHLVGFAIITWTGLTLLYLWITKSLFWEFTCAILSGFSCLFSLRMNSNDSSWEACVIDAGIAFLVANLGLLAAAHNRDGPMARQMGSTSGLSGEAVNTKNDSKT